METEAKTGYTTRLIYFRQNAGKTVEETAAAIGMSPQSYADLESYDNELADCISLYKLMLLAKTLNFSLGDLFSDNGDVPQKAMTLEQLRDEILQYLETLNITVGQFENEVGWEVEKALSAPAEFLNLNLTGLKDLCNKIGVSWLSVLSTLNVPSNVPGRPEDSVR